MVDLTQLSEIEVLALTIYGEARGERIEGQVAVGCVIRNRVLKRGKTYQEICLANLQFSCWNRTDPNRVVLVEWADKMMLGEDINQAHLNQCIWISKGIVNEQIMDNTRGADHYLTNKLFSEKTVSWANDLSFKAIIGNHVFLA